MEVAGPVEYIHQWVDMTSYPVQLANGSLAKTCKAALGYSFAAGTTDGPGEFDFTQGLVKTKTKQNILRRNTFFCISTLRFSTLHTLFKIVQ